MGRSTKAEEILNALMRFRRFSAATRICHNSSCPNCLAPHLTRIQLAIEQSKPVTFILPAFPGKSPNPAKVLGPLPDLAERCALEFLQQLCDQIQRIYLPGAQIILCSDGRIFSDVVGLRDEDVTAYQKGIEKIIVEMKLHSISTFNLEERLTERDFGQMRAALMEQFGESLETLRGAVKTDPELNHLYCGITRFLVEDALHPGQTSTRAALQKKCRIRAYEVIRRSQAWSRLIEAHFPTAVRLSIHPQRCGAQKLGIRLLEASPWQTPWHGVAVQVNGKFILLKRAEAERLGADLIYQDGHPSHYVLKEPAYET